MARGVATEAIPTNEHRPRRSPQSHDRDRPVLDGSGFPCAGSFDKRANEWSYRIRTSLRGSKLLRLRTVRWVCLASCPTPSPSGPT